LFIRDGCHLCENFIEELAVFNKKQSLPVQIKDVDSSNEWLALYGHKVPVLVIDDKLVCEFFFDPDKVSPYCRD
jgi:hypothetical protein